MPGVHRQGDVDASCCAVPTQPCSYSSNVLTNGRGTVRMADSIIPHMRDPKTCPLHGGTFSGGNSTVLVNGRAIQRIGDSISCGACAISGSQNVIA